MMTKAHPQEALSQAYVQAVAAHDGMTISVRGHDYGTDLTLHEIENEHGVYTETGWRLDLQLRTTTVAKFGATHVTYDLDVRTYNYLCNPKGNEARLLVLLLLGQDEDDWVSYTDDRLSIRAGAYWMTFRGHSASSFKKTVRVWLPRRNRFTAASLISLMHRVSRGEIV